MGLAENAPEVSGSAPSIEDGWKRYFDDRRSPGVMGGVSVNTLKRYQPVSEYHIQFCKRNGLLTWNEVDKRSTENYGRWRAENAADATLKLELDLVVSIKKFLVEEKLLPAAQLFTLNLSKPQGTDRYCFLREEVTAMVRYCQQTASLAWFADVIIGFATTGFRSETLNGLRWTDIDFKSAVIRVKDERASRRKKKLGSIRTLKGKRDHTLPLHPSFQEVLNRLPRHSDGLVFHGPRGGRLHSRNVLDVLKRKVIKPLIGHFPTPPSEIGFEYGVVHSFRHFFCSEAFRQGATEAEVLAWLGNRDSKMILIYRHLRPDDSKRRMKGIDFLGDGNGATTN
jgi:integrase